MCLFVSMDILGYFSRSITLIFIPKKKKDMLFGWNSVFQIWVSFPRTQSPTLFNFSLGFPFLQKLNHFGLVQWTFNFWNLLNQNHCIFENAQKSWFDWFEWAKLKASGWCSLSIIFSVSSLHDVWSNWVVFVSS